VALEVSRRCSRTLWLGFLPGHAVGDASLAEPSDSLALWKRENAHISARGTRSVRSFVSPSRLVVVIHERDDHEWIN
jgi:hypothetical protein